MSQSNKILVNAADQISYLSPSTPPPKKKKIMSIQSSKKKMDFLLPKLIFFFTAVQGSYEKKEKKCFSWQSRAVYSKILKS